MKKAVYIWLFTSFFAATFANQPVEISSLSSPEYVLKSAPFTLSAKIFKPISEQSVELYLHTNFDVSLKSVELAGLHISKPLRFYRVDVDTELDKTYKIESGSLGDTEDQIFQVNFKLTSSGDKSIKLYLSGKENYYTEEQKLKQTREINIYRETGSSGKSLKLYKDSEVNFHFSTKNYNSKNILLEFWAKLNGDHLKFVSIENSLGKELTSLSVSEFGYLSVPNLLDAEFFDELYVDQNNWNYYLIKLDDDLGEIKAYLNNDLFYKGICNGVTDQSDFNLRLISMAESEAQFDRLKIWAFDNNESLALLNKNFNAYGADSSKIILQNNFDTDNSISELNFTGQLKLEESDAPIFSKAPSLNVVLFGQSYNLSWEVSELTNAQKFTVEKSYDGTNYFEVNTLQVVDESKTSYNISDYDYTDNQIIYYRIKQVNKDDTEIYSSNVKVGRGEVKHFTMEQNYPNPFNPLTTISIQVDKSAEFEVLVYDIVGKKVATIHRGRLTEGVHNFSFDGSELPSGLYLCEVKSGEVLEVMKMILAK